jgi:uncharacterized protein YrrD
MKAAFDIVGLPVRDEAGRLVGSVRDLLFDDAGRRLIAVVLRRGFLRPREEVLPFEQVRAIRKDRVIAADQTEERTATPPGGAASDSLEGKHVVSRAGRFLGLVQDVYVDERTGQVQAYEVARRIGKAARRPILISVDTAPIIGDVIVVPDAPHLTWGPEHKTRTFRRQ